MQFAKAVLGRIADGQVDLAFRRWNRPSAKSGGRLRTAIGVLAFDEVRAVCPEDVSEDDARRAGFRSREELFADLRPGTDRTLYRISVRLDAADPRVALRDTDRPTEAELHAVLDKLARMDARSGRGQWTTRVLTAIARRPRTRAAELAVEVDRDTQRFKADVRKLKDLGLTRSLDVGYELSPRGRRILRQLSEES